MDDSSHKTDHKTEIIPDSQVQMTGDVRIWRILKRDRHFAFALYVTLGFILASVAHIAIEPLLLAVLAGGLTYLGLKLAVADKKEEFALKALDTIKEAQNVLSASSCNLTEKGQTLNQLVEKTEELHGQIIETSKQVQKWTGLSVELLRGIPQLEEITRGLKPDEAYRVYESISRSSHGYSRAWYESLLSLKIEPSPTVLTGWINLLQTYLAEQQDATPKYHLLL